MSEQQPVTVIWRGLAGRRIIGPYVWDVTNGYTTTVTDPEVLTAIRNDLRFVIDEPATDEPDTTEAAE